MNNQSNQDNREDHENTMEEVMPEKIEKTHLSSRWVIWRQMKGVQNLADRLVVLGNGPARNFRLDGGCVCGLHRHQRDGDPLSELLVRVREHGKGPLRVQGSRMEHLTCGLLRIVGPWKQNSESPGWNLPLEYHFFENPRPDTPDIRLSLQDQVDHFILATRKIQTRKISCRFEIVAPHLPQLCLPASKGFLCHRRYSAAPEIRPFPDIPSIRTTKNNTAKMICLATIGIPGHESCNPCCAIIVFETDVNGRVGENELDFLVSDRLLNFVERERADRHGGGESRRQKRGRCLPSVEAFLFTPFCEDTNQDGVVFLGRELRGCCVNRGQEYRKEKQTDNAGHDLHEEASPGAELTDRGIHNGL